jgi:hypothetical protein
METGHLRVQGCLNGKSVMVIVDTGAGNTVVSLEVAISLDLDLLQLEESGVGAGGADLPIYEVTGGDFSLFGLRPQIDQLIALDLSHVNEGLARKGCEPVDTILGADIFEKHSAVIDFGSSSLYLKPI